MIRSRLSFARLYLKVLMLLLPTCAYLIAVVLRFGFHRPHARTPFIILSSYWPILLLTTVEWVIIAEESGLWNVEQLYPPRGKSQRLLEALGFTYAFVLTAGFLYRSALYSRVVV